MRFLGCSLLLLGLTSSAFATEAYREIWNPPETRGVPLHRATTGHTPVKHTRAMEHLVKMRTHRTLTTMSVPKLAMKQHNTTAKAPDVTDIPRQITPEENVLRVDSRDASAEVTR